MSPLLVDIHGKTQIIFPKATDDAKIHLHHYITTLKWDSGLFTAPLF